MAKDNRFSGLQRKAMENPFYIFEKKKQHAGANKCLDGYWQMWAQVAFVLSICPK